MATRKVHGVEGRLSLPIDSARSPLAIVFAAADRLRERITHVEHLRTKRARAQGDLAERRYDLLDVAKQFGAAANRRVRDQDRIAVLAAALEAAANAYAQVEGSCNELIERSSKPAPGRVSRRAA